MLLLLWLQHITRGKDWKMASVVLDFKVFMGPEWNDAADSDKLMLSWKCIGMLLRWCIPTLLTQSVYNFLYSELTFSSVSFA